MITSLRQSTTECIATSERISTEWWSVLLRTLLLEIKDHGFMLGHPHLFCKESDISVLFCNRTFARLFQNETLALCQYQNMMTGILA